MSLISQVEDAYAEIIQKRSHAQNIKDRTTLDKQRIGQRRKGIVRGIVQCKKDRSTKRRNHDEKNKKINNKKVKR